MKMSPQGQVTIPRRMREELNLHPGSRISLRVCKDGGVEVSGKLPVEELFGTMPGAWLEPGEDASEYTRKQRDEINSKLDRL
jgi:AbrB family looped-hinge helix DNA binding protein